MADSFLSDYLVPFTLAITMLGMGLSLEKKDFLQVFKYPKALFTGVLTKMFILPLIAFCIALLIDIDIEYKIGLILIAACPGGATTNLLTYLLRGNLALSISMTAINSIIVLFTLPVTLSLSLIYFYGISREIELPILNTIINVFMVTIIPTLIGILIRRNHPNIALQLEKPLRYVLPAILLSVFAGVLIFEYKNGTSTFRSSVILFPIGLLLNILGMASGKYISMLMKLRKRNQFTIAIEIGLQNSALAIFIAGSILGNSKIALVAVIYSAFSFFSTALFGHLIKKYL